MHRKRKGCARKEQSYSVAKYDQEETRKRMRQTTNKNLTKQILTLMLAFVMVFTGMGIGSWGVDTAWADEAVTQSADPWDGTTTTEPTQVDGVYQIGKGAELAWFAGLVNGTLTGTAKNVKANAILTSDIDLGNCEWTPAST